MVRNLLLGAVAIAAIAMPAKASLMLTSDGTSLGFSLSKYYSDTSYYGILGVTSGPGGYIYGAGYSHGQIIKLPHTDGQTYGSAIATASSPGTPTGMAYVGGKLYLGVLGGGYYSVDPSTLASTALSLDHAVSHAYGLWGNPVTGHLLAGDGYGLLDIDPVSGHVTTVGPGSGLDGVTVSTDGTVGYGEFSGYIRGYSLTAPDPSTPVFTSAYLPGGPDGTGIITGGDLNGQIIVNMNDGSIVLLDPVTNTSTIIATGGTRGDLVGPDLTSGTLLLDFSYDGLWRLSYKGGSIGGGGGGGSGNPGVPEPATLFLVAAGLLGFGAWRRARAI